MSDTEHEHIEPPIAQSRRAWVRGALLGATLLVFGAIIGSSLTVMAIKRQRDAERREGPSRTTRLVDTLTSEMDLTEDQTEQINAIVSRHDEAMHEIFRTFRGEAQSEMQAMKDDIANVLTPEQKAYWQQRWDEQMEKWRKRREEERSRRGEASRRRSGDNAEERTTATPEPN
jgi:Spy/CpxP family protein refolding chaperone